MTDPRIIACAQAAGITITQALDCVEKWLAQAPTPAMTCYPLNLDPTMQEVRASLYRLACDAAAKEILEALQTQAGK